MGPAQFVRCLVCEFKGRGSIFKAVLKLPSPKWSFLGCRKIAARQASPPSREGGSSVLSNDKRLNGAQTSVNKYFWALIAGGEDESITREPRITLNSYFFKYTLLVPKFTLTFRLPVLLFCFLSVRFCRTKVSTSDFYKHVFRGGSWGWSCAKISLGSCFGVQ